MTAMRSPKRRLRRVALKPNKGLTPTASPSTGPQQLSPSVERSLLLQATDSSWPLAFSPSAPRIVGLFHARAIGTSPSLVVYVSESASKPARVEPWRASLFIAAASYPAVAQPPRCARPCGPGGQCRWMPVGSASAHPPPSCLQSRSGSGQSASRRRCGPQA